MQESKYVIILVAVFGKMANVDLAFLNNHELDLNTSTSMKYTHVDYVDTIIFVNKGKIKLSLYGLNIFFPFQEFFNTYKYIDNNREKTMKVSFN